MLLNVVSNITYLAIGNSFFINLNDRYDLPDITTNYAYRKSIKYIKTNNLKSTPSSAVRYQHQRFLHRSCSSAALLMPQIVRYSQRHSCHRLSGDLIPLS